MRYLFRTFEGIGFISMLIGMGSMDSDSVAVPIAMIFLGIALFAFSSYVDDWYVWNERRSR